MNTRRLTTLRSICFVALLGLGIVTTAQGQTAAPAAPMSPAAPMAGMPNNAMKGNMMGSADMKKSMMMNMESMQKMPMSGDTDKDFAVMMKMHHQQALNMAEFELAHGQSPAMKTMAKQIIAAQKKEIAQFDQWLAKQK